MCVNVSLLLRHITCLLICWFLNWFCYLRLGSGECLNWGHIKGRSFQVIIELITRLAFCDVLVNDLFTLQLGIASRRNWMSSSISSSMRSTASAFLPRRVSGFTTRWNDPLNVTGSGRERDLPPLPPVLKNHLHWTLCWFSLIFSSFSLYLAEKTFHLIIRNPGVPKCSSEKVIVTSGFKESEQGWRAIKSRKFGQGCQWRGLGGVFWGTGCGCERIGVRVEVV